MAEQSTRVLAELRDRTANPAPFGLMAFGLTTVLLNLHNAGLFGMNTMILAMGLFYGGVAQVIACLQEYKKNNTFGATAFGSYGLFWLTLVGILAFPKWMGIEAPDATALGCYLFMWGVFTGLMFVGTLKINRSLQTVFSSLTVLFVLLAVAEWTGNETLGKIAGWEGVFVGLAAVYTSAAMLWNELYGRQVLPIGPVVKAEAKKPAAILTKGRQVSA